MKKILIRDKDIGIIKEKAIIAFKNRQDFSGFDNKEMQVYCILAGLDQYLSGLGVQVGYELEGFVQQDCWPVDDSGLDEMVPDVVEEIKP